MSQEKQVVLVPDYLTVREVAELIEASPIEVMKRLIANGIMASINQQIDFDTAAIVVEEMGFEAQSASAAAAKVEREQRAESAQTWRRVYAQEKPGLGIEVDEKIAAKFPFPDGPPNFDYSWGTTRRRDGTVIRP